MNQVVSGGRRKLHYLYPDNTEMVEEFDVNSNECLRKYFRSCRLIKRNLVRKWKKPKEFGVAQWEIEIGTEQSNFNPESDLLAPSSQNPIFMRKDSESRFEWRIRNLPYPKDTYSIEIDHNKQEIVLRTSNKKYYKRFDIPDLKRAGL